MWRLFQHPTYDNNSNPRTRTYSLSENTREELIVRLRSPNAEVRAIAAEQIDALADVNALEPLLAALKDEDITFRRHVIYALANLHDSRVIEPLMNVALNDPSAWVRKWAVIGLGELKDARAIDTLVLALRDRASFVGSEAARALAAIGDPRVVKTLLLFLDPETSPIWWDVVYALGELKDPVCIKPLIALLSHKDDDVRYSVIVALGKIGYMEPLSFLEQIRQNDVDQDVRDAVSEAIEKIEASHRQMP